MKAYLMYKRDDFIVDESFPAHFTFWLKTLSWMSSFRRFPVGMIFCIRW